MRYLKLFFRLLFSTHAYALAFTAWILYCLFKTVGTTRATHVTTFEDWFLFALTFVIVLGLGWLAGRESCASRTRRLRLSLMYEREQATYMRRLNANMIDDVLLAQRNGLKVTSLAYPRDETEMHARWPG